MNILLIRPRPHKETIGLQNVMICEPLELMQLSAVLRANNHVVNIVDMILEKAPLSSFIEMYKPNLVGITGYISHIGIMKTYAKEIKSLNKNIAIAVGGVHAAVCPSDFIDENIDFICKTEGDFYNIAKCEDLTPLHPYRDLKEEYLNKYYYLFANKCALIKTSFGCPYNCNFCFCKEISPYKARNIDDVIKELLEIKQKEVYIVDDDFLFNRERLLEFAEKVEQNNIHKNYLVYGRADFIAGNEDIMKRLAEIGLDAVIVGLEAATQSELDSYNKKTTLSDNEKAVAILKKYNIECYATTILGVDWDKSDFNKLYKFIKGLGVVFVNLQPFTPMPGTEYFDEYRNNLIIPYTEHEKWDMAHLVVKPEKLSLRAYYWEIIKLYYKITLPPKNVLYILKRYGFIATFKLSFGAMEISLQYLRKVIRG